MQMPASPSGINYPRLCSQREAFAPCFCLHSTSYILLTCVSLQRDKELAYLSLGPQLLELGQTHGGHLVDVWEGEGWGGERIGLPF